MQKEKKSFLIVKISKDYNVYNMQIPLKLVFNKCAICASLEHLKYLCTLPNTLFKEERWKEVQTQT